MTKVAIIGTGPCGLSMLRSFEQAEKKGEKCEVSRKVGLSV